MLEHREVATGLRFPEGPIALADGGVLLVEVARGTLTRVNPDGRVEVVAETGGGPNGGAFGPDGKVYICNNGGFFTWHEAGELTMPGETPDTWAGGSIQRVDLDTGEVETIYTGCEELPFLAPNDIVFDEGGGFWFTDHGVRSSGQDRAGGRDRAGVLYGEPDGSAVTAVARGTDATNGIGLSPDGTRLYVAETHTGRLWCWDVVGPGAVDTSPDADAPHGGRLLYDAPEGHLFDSLAVDGEGWVCVATLGQGGITAVAPDGSEVQHLRLPDPLVTNICFGGDDDDLRTAFITASGTGKLLSAHWPRRGLALAF